MNLHSKPKNSIFHGSIKRKPKTLAFLLEFTPKIFFRRQKPKKKNKKNKSSKKGERFRRQVWQIPINNKIFNRNSIKETHFFRSKQFKNHSFYIWNQRTKSKFQNFIVPTNCASKRSIFSTRITLKISSCSHFNHQNALKKKSSTRKIGLT